MFSKIKNELIRNVENNNKKKCRQRISTHQTLGTSIEGYVSFGPGNNFIFVTNTRRINTPTQSSRRVIVGSLQRANLPPKSWTP